MRYTVNLNMMHEALTNLVSQNTNLRDSDSSSPNKMGDYEREAMVKMMTDKVTAHGQLEAELEAEKKINLKLQVENQQLKAEMQKLQAENQQLKAESGNKKIDTDNWKGSWDKLYKTLALKLHPDKPPHGNHVIFTELGAINDWMKGLFEGTIF